MDIENTNFHHDRSRDLFIHKGELRLWKLNWDVSDKFHKIESLENTIELEG